MKYLDERLNVAFTGVSLSGLVPYKVSYAGKVIFVGNCYISSTDPTLDITDIVRSYEATLSEYGTQHTYVVGLYKSSSDTTATYSASLQVANIYRYPHKLANYSNKLQDYYADCNADGDLKLPARYPDNNTTAIHPELYKASGYIYSPNRSEISTYKGNSDYVLGDLIDRDSQNLPDNVIIGSTDDTGTIFEIKSVFPPTNLYVTEYGGDNFGEEVEYLIDGYPYVNSFSVQSQKGKNPYLLDLYIGDEYDVNHYNYYPSFYNGFVSEGTPRYEDLNLSINKVDNKLGEDFFGDTEFEVTGNKLTYDYSNIQPSEFYINAYDESGNNLWEAGIYQFPSEGDFYIQDDGDYAFSNIAYLEVTCDDDMAPTLRVDLNTNLCQVSGFKIHYNLTYDSAPHIALTFEDAYYDCLCLFNLYVKNHTNTAAYTNYKFDWTTKKAGEAENLILYNVTNAGNDMIYTFSKSTSHTTTVKIYGKDGVVVANKTIDFYDTTSSNEIQIFYDNHLFVTDFYIDITANYTDGSFARAISYISGTVCLYNYVLVSKLDIVLRCLNYESSWKSSIYSIIYTYDLTYSLPISELTCPTGYFLQWRDRWGSLQCQPFSKVSTYSEEITASEITSYYGKRSIYKTENQPKWKIQTGWLSDDLYPVYEGIFVSGTLTLYDADTDTAYDVILSDRNYTEKTFRNQGKMFNLELTLELSEKQNILY